jgi:hypothetical protein
MTRRKSGKWTRTFPIQIPSLPSTSPRTGHSEIPMYIADTYLGLRVPFMRPALRAQLSDLHPAKRIHLLYRLWWDRPHGNALDLMSVITAVRGFTNLNGVDLIKQRGTLEVHPTTGRFIASSPHLMVRIPYCDATGTGRHPTSLPTISTTSSCCAGAMPATGSFVMSLSPSEADASETLQTDVAGPRPAPLTVTP